MVRFAGGKPAKFGLFGSLIGRERDEGFRVARRFGRAGADRDRGR